MNILDEKEQFEKRLKDTLNIPEDYRFHAIDDMREYFWMHADDEICWGEESCEEYSNEKRSDIWPSQCGEFMSVLVDGHFRGERFIMVFEKKLEELDV